MSKAGHSADVRRVSRAHFFSDDGAAGADAAGADVPAPLGAAVFDGGVAAVPLAAGGAVEVPGAVEPVGGGKAGPLVFDEAVVPAAVNASPWCFAQNKAIKQKTIEIDAVTIVIRVKISPAFAPNALDPPMPPRAPASPPPRPR